MNSKKLHNLWMSLTGKARHASNYSYDIRKNIYTQLINDGRLDAGKLLPKVDNSAQKELLGNVCAMASNRIAGQFASTAEVNKTESFITANQQHMTTEFLDRIEQIAIASGLLVLAHAVHKQNEKLILQCAAIKRNTAKLFWSSINNGGDDAVLKMLNHIEQHGKRDAQQHYRKLCIALGLLPKDVDITEQHPEHKAFADFVKDKSIAIVGPSSSGADYGEEIKRDFDIIIRTSYGGRDSLPETQRDLPPHISYYRWFHMKKFFADLSEDISYLSDLDFAILKRRNEEIQSRVQSYTKARYALSIPDFFFFGTPNMIPIILQDLSHFTPARIKVFYANLFLTQAIHDKGYITFTKGTLEHWRSNAKHNLICQYEYMMHLFRRGLMEADPRLSEILSLGTAEYMNQMEKQENQKSLTP